MSGLVWVWLVRVAKGCVVVVLLVLLVVALAAFDPTEVPAPSGPVPTPASTGPAPTVRPEEDEPGWICTAADDSCDETSY